MDTASKVIGGVVLALCVIAMIGFAVYPSTVTGTNRDALAASINEEAGNDWTSQVGYSITCTPGEHAEWRCGGYYVESDWRGCWEADQIRGDKTLSACITFFDSIGLNDPLPDPS
jgi:hypothetical protein